MLDAFRRLGMVYENGMGVIALPYTEIAAAAPWATSRERDVIRDMSRDYLRGMNIGSDPFGIEPWSGEDG